MKKKSPGNRGTTLPPPSPPSSVVNDKVLYDIHKKILASSALNGGFDTLLYKIDKIEQGQSQVSTKVDKIHDAIYHPDEGLFARIAANKAAQIENVSQIEKKLVEVSYGGKLPENKQKIIDFLDKVAEDKLQKVIDKSCKDIKNYLNCRSQKMQMKRESIADKAIWTAKKRYILNVYDSEGVRYEKAKLKLQGIEAVKSSTPEVCRQKIKDAINLILTKSQNDLHQYITSFKSEFKNLPPESIAFPRGCNGISTYADNKTIFKKGTPIHVRGALVYNRVIKDKHLDKKYPCIQEGDKIKFIYLKTPNPVQQNVITMSEEGLPQELNLHKYIDYELQFEKTFIDPLKIILDAINWSTKKTMSFDDL